MILEVGKKAALSTSVVCFLFSNLQSVCSVMGVSSSNCQPIC